MSKEILEKRLQNTLEKLEDASQRLVQTRGYTRDVRVKKALSELMKEQISSEGTGSSANKIR